MVVVDVELIVDLIAASTELSLKTIPSFSASNISWRRADLGMRSGTLAHDGRLNIEHTHRRLLWQLVWLRILLWLLCQCSGALVAGNEWSKVGNHVAGNAAIPQRRIGQSRQRAYHELALLELMQQKERPSKNPAWTKDITDNCYARSISIISLLPWKCPSSYLPPIKNASKSSNVKCLHINLYRRRSMNTLSFNHLPCTLFCTQ